MPYKTRRTTISSVTYCENESYTKLKNRIIMKNAKYSINANLVYKNGYSGKNVNIAVLDTGVFKRHKAYGFGLVHRLWL